MPYATNPIDSRSIYFEDDGGGGPPIVILAGFTSSTDTARNWPVAQAMRSDYRLIYIDQRGHGRSDKPHDVTAYKMSTRVADVVAVLDALGLEKAHIVAGSYGARLAFGVAVYARDRMASLTAYGMAPGEIGMDGPVVGAVQRAMASPDDMEGFVREMAAFMPVAGPVRDRLMSNDQAALAASWHANRADHDFTSQLADLTVPCLLLVGTEDEDFHEAVKRDAPLLPNATLIEMPGKAHFTGFVDDSIVPHIREHIAGVSPG